MGQLFSILTKAMESNPGIAIGASLVWGWISILFSPCHLASIPLIIGYVGDQKELTLKKAFFTSLSFSLGIFASVTGLGLITVSMGRLLGDIGPWGNYIVGIILILVGLNLMGLLPFKWSNISLPGTKGKGWLSAFILGFVFGVGLGPCTFAFMAPVLGVLFNVASTRYLYAITLLFVFAIGHISLIILAGTFTEVVQRYLHWSENSRGIKIVKIICGLLVIIGGIYLIYKGFSL